MTYPTGRAPSHQPNLIADLFRSGFRPGLPAGFSPAARDVDEDVCWRGDCNCCGAGHLKYVPLHRGRSYKAVAHCTRCQHQEEF